METLKDIVFYIIVTAGVFTFAVLLALFRSFGLRARRWEHSYGEWVKRGEL